MVSSTEKVVEFLREREVLRTSATCSKCVRPMSTQKRRNAYDGICFRCSKCKAEKSIRIGSLLVDCRLSLQVFASLLYLLQTEMPFKFIAEILDLRVDTVGDYANLLREEYSKDLIENGQMLGGLGRIVQIDEPLLAKAKRARNNHARPVREQWVFGGYDGEARLGWIELVENRERETLFPLIREWCHEGSIIVSDAWPAYCHIREGVIHSHIQEQLGFEHRIVVHEHNFVDPDSGAHTNNVEAYWQRCKRRFKRMYGTSRILLPSHVDEFLWQERLGRTHCDGFVNTLEQLKRHYTQ